MLDRHQLKKMLLQAQLQLHLNVGFVTVRTAHPSRRRKVLGGVQIVTTSKVPIELHTNYVAFLCCHAEIALS